MDRSVSMNGMDGNMKNRIDYWYDRINLNRVLQKELQVETIGMTLNEHDIKDLLDILGAFKQVIEKGDQNDS